MQGWRLGWVDGAMAVALRQWGLRWVTLGVAGLVTLVAPLAYAGRPPPPPPAPVVVGPPPSDADIIGESAKRTAEAGDIKKAIELYRRAFSMTGESRFAWNLARLYELSDTLPEAHRWYVVARKTAVNVEKRAKTSEAIGLVEAKLLRGGFARLEVSPQPQDATVTVADVVLDAEDGRAVRWLAAGNYAVQVSAVGHVAQQTYVQLAASEDKKLRIALQPVVAAPGVVVPVAVEPPGPPVAALAAAGVGVAGLALGAVWMAGGAADKQAANKLPILVAGDIGAYQTAAAAADGKWQRGAATLGVGAVALGVATYLWLGRPPTKTARLCPMLGDGVMGGVVTWPW